MTTNNKRSQNSGNNNANQGTSNRGFAGMDADRQREIASEGGKAAHAKGTAHEFDSQSGREAGRKGGLNRAQNANQNSNSSSSGAGVSDWDSSRNYSNDAGDTDDASVL